MNSDTEVPQMALLGDIHQFILDCAHGVLMRDGYTESQRAYELLSRIDSEMTQQSLLQAKTNAEGLRQCRDLLSVKEGDNLWDAINRMLLTFHRQRQGLRVAHDMMQTWFSSEYLTHPQTKLVGAALDVDPLPRPRGNLHDARKAFFGKEYGTPTQFPKSNN